jgi:hypothetical protein
MPIVEFTPESARELWRHAIGWILGKIAFRLDKHVPEPINGLVRRLD